MSLLKQEMMTKEATGEEDIFDACEVKVYAGRGTAQGKFVILAKELEGRSAVANQVEKIATAVRRTLNARAEQIVFIEHHPERANFDETFDLVHLDYKKGDDVFTKPDWSHFTKEKTEEITGEEINIDLKIRA